MSRSKDKSNLVKKIFENVSGRYDLMNDFMSLGIHRVWKKSMLDWLAPRRGQSLIDVAGGTGDIAFNFIKRAKTGANATILDLTESMMLEAKKKKNHRSPKRITNKLGLWRCHEDAI